MWFFPSKAKLKTKFAASGSKVFKELGYKCFPNELPFVSICYVYMYYCWNIYVSTKGVTIKHAIFFRAYRTKELD